MTKIETAITAFDNWAKPYEFFKSVSEKLSGDDLVLFQDIWEKAIDREIWRIHDLILACKITHTFIRDNYRLDDHAIGLIVRAASYDWK